MHTALVWFLVRMKADHVRSHQRQLVAGSGVSIREHVSKREGDIAAAVTQEVRK